MREGIDAYRILVKTPERRKPIGRSGRKWEANIKKDFLETEWGID
jgi:hypothetical protein